MTAIDKIKHQIKTTQASINQLKKEGKTVNAVFTQDLRELNQELEEALEWE